MRLVSVGTGTSMHKVGAWHPTSAPAASRPAGNIKGIQNTDFRIEYSVVYDMMQRGHLVELILKVVRMVTGVPF